MAITTINNRSINRSDTAAAGQVWTATSATAADFQAGGGMVKISAQTISSGVSSVDFDDVFSSTYNVYELYYSNLGVATDDVDLWCRCKTASGVLSGGSDYVYGVGASASNGAWGSTYDTGEDEGTLTKVNLGNAATESAGGRIRFFGPTNTTHHKQVQGIQSGMSNGSDALGQYASFACKTTTALTGFQLLPSSGNIDSGEFVLYGITA